MQELLRDGGAGRQGPNDESSQQRTTTHGLVWYYLA
jgi:hypothetical protein